MEGNLQFDQARKKAVHLSRMHVAENMSRHVTSRMYVRSQHVCHSFKACQDVRAWTCLYLRH